MSANYFSFCASDALPWPGPHRGFRPQTPLVYSPPSPNDNSSLGHWYQGVKMHEAAVNQMRSVEIVYLCHACWSLLSAALLVYGSSGHTLPQ